MIEITLEDYIRLRNAEIMLGALEAFGVQDWSKYWEARRAYWEAIDEVEEQEQIPYSTGA